MNMLRSPIASQWRPDKQCSPGNLLILLIVVVVAGCSSIKSHPRYGILENADLYRWIDDELSPYLVDELSRQPRFKGQSIALYAPRRSASARGTDQLTNEVHERLTDQLISVAGLKLVHGRDLYVPAAQRDRLECQKSVSADYKISIEIDAPATGRSRLRVRALDTDTDTWVASFGKSWQGYLTAAQWTKFNTIATPAQPRGSRDLPYNDTETDLLAAYLATRIRCDLQRRYSSAQLKIEPYAGDYSGVNQVLDLVARNLGYADAGGSLPSARAADRNLVHSLSAKLISVDGELHQLWVRSRISADNSELIQLQNSVYLSMSPESILYSVQQINTPAKTGSSSFHQNTEANNQSNTILSRLNIDSDPEYANCSHAQNGGHQRIEGMNASAGCFAVELSLYQPAYLTIIRHQVNGHLTRVPVDGCRTLVNEGARLQQATDMRVPDLAVREADWVTSESLYAIAITDRYLARKVSLHAQLLPNDCGFESNSHSVQFELEWLATLDSLLEQNQSSVDWRAVTIDS